ncbi:hypothetical protein GCM10010371_48880 [Streptomyces subrutilus]|uniref:Uncharacterized protein n=1 Tax=Streptomyces subrutilus TaxID=36818 RepID=A0A918VB54_9ACTN|nr:hypothetical protein GCM10010371_48880 [Streptomyces subrutilus]
MVPKKRIGSGSGPPGAAWGAGVGGWSRWSSLTPSIIPRRVAPPGPVSRGGPRRPARSTPAPPGTGLRPDPRLTRRRGWDGRARRGGGRG